MRYQSLASKMAQANGDQYVTDIDNIDYVLSLTPSTTHRVSTLMNLSILPQSGKSIHVYTYTEHSINPAPSLLSLSLCCCCLGIMVH